MMKRLIAIAAIALSACGFVATDSKATSMSPLVEDIIFIGCTVPAQGTNGMTVYSLEAVAGNGKWIATELGNTKDDAEDSLGKRCSVTLNKIIGTAKGCPVDKNWQPVLQPGFNTLANSGYALNLFMLMCVYNYSG